MPLVVTPESEWGKELAKWNKPYEFAMFPKMLYKATRREDGIVSVAEADDALFGGQPGAAESFSARCQMTVKDDRELTRFIEMGWRESPGAALEFFEEKALALGASAAHRAHDDRNMGDKAKAEAEAIEASTPEHVAEVPRKRVRRRKRA